LLNGSVHILVSEEFQNERQVIGIEEELRQVFKFEDV